MTKRTAETDKAKEHARYERNAKTLLTRINLENINRKNLGARAIPIWLREPYTFYERLLENYTTAISNVLELGSGTGMHTGCVLEQRCSVIATDISKSSLEVLEYQFRNFANLKTLVCDMENLPFSEGSFDLIFCSGSLSYGEPKIVMKEIKRVLKKNGIFICVDSFNHNWIYRFNRWVHFLRARRTISTLKRIPSQTTLDMYRDEFSEIEVNYFGSIAWLSPLLRLMVGANRASKIVSQVDNLINVKRSAFKFVMVARK